MLTVSIMKRHQGHGALVCALKNPGMYKVREAHVGCRTACLLTHPTSIAVRFGLCAHLPPGGLPLGR
jgi:S-formylglutathione hydrolase FrmB